MTDALEQRVQAWVEPWPNGRHLLRTRGWLLELEPKAGLALRIAALTHDAERNFPHSPRQPADRPANDRAYRDAHQARSAEVVDAWLRDQGAGIALRESVRALIQAHEWGGPGEADLLQAADSISFLEVNADHAQRWMREHGYSGERAGAQFEWMYERISLPRARQLARPFYVRAMALIARVASEGSGAGESGEHTGP